MKQHPTKAQWQEIEKSLGMFYSGVYLRCDGYLVYASMKRVSMNKLAGLFLIPIGTALLFPATTSLVSRYSECHELGVTLGVQQGYGGVARFAGPIWAGAAFQYLGVGAPFFLSAALVVGTLVFALGLAPPPVDRTAAMKIAAPTA